MSMIWLWSSRVCCVLVIRIEICFTELLAVFEVEILRLLVSCIEIPKPMRTIIIVNTKPYQRQEISKDNTIYSELLTMT